MTAQHLARLDQDLAAISEGMCPEHAIPLRDTGWCVICRKWWSADCGEQTVTAVYPVPVSLPPES